LWCDMIFLQLVFSIPSPRLGDRKHKTHWIKIISHHKPWEILYKLNRLFHVYKIIKICPNLFWCLQMTHFLVKDRIVSQFYIFFRDILQRVLIRFYLVSKHQKKKKKKKKKKSIKKGLISRVKSVLG
jgi:hypothetical protein